MKEKWTKIQCFWVNIVEVTKCRSDLFYPIKRFNQLYFLKIPIIYDPLDNQSFGFFFIQPVEIRIPKIGFVQLFQKFRHDDLNWYFKDSQNLNADRWTRFLKNAENAWLIVDYPGWGKTNGEETSILSIELIISVGVRLKVAHPLCCDRIRIWLIG